MLGASDEVEIFAGGKRLSELLMFSESHKKYRCGAHITLSASLPSTTLNEPSPLTF